MHGAFVQFHNILMARMVGDPATAAAIADTACQGIRTDVWEAMPPRMTAFEQVRRFVRLHYQWLVLHDFLPAFVAPEALAQALAGDPFGAMAPLMPAEFSAAGFRFGHATVQTGYCLRTGQPEVDLFAMRGGRPRDTSQTIEMAQFFGPAAQRARPVGITMAATLFDLPPTVVEGPLHWGRLEIPPEQARKLALRNILRDRTTLALPSGQQMARALGLPETPAPAVLRAHGVTKTPLWYAVLEEAACAGGGRLTGAGGLIVASVLVRLMRCDPESVLNTPGFTPWPGFGAPFSMAALMRFVETGRTGVPQRAALMTG